MVIGNYKDEKKYHVIATMIVKDGVDIAFADENVPGRLLKKLELVMHEIMNYVAEKEGENL